MEKTIMNLNEKIKAWLKENSVEFRELHHEITKTSEESAKARGESIEIGGKALILKVDDTFGIFVLSAAKQLDSAKLKNAMNAKKSRFATPEELMELTSLVPGSVPPFGEPILPLPLYADESITRNERIAFNAASLTDSIIFSTQDYLRLAQPIILSFSKES